MMTEYSRLQNMSLSISICPLETYLKTALESIAVILRSHRLLVLCKSPLSLENITFFYMESVKSESKR